MSEYDEICECGARKGDHALEPPHPGTRSFCDGFIPPQPVSELIGVMKARIDAILVHIENNNYRLLDGEIDRIRGLLTTAQQRGRNEISRREQLP